MYEDTTQSFEHYLVFSYCNFPKKMPKQLKEWKKMVQLINERDSSGILYLKGGGVHKFKVRSGKYLFTFKTTSKKVANDIQTVITSGNRKYKTIQAKRIRQVCGIEELAEKREI
ncbi:hypothetical protein SNEBB_009732 [Seison nebaliae]|nr:hypothetical protein SNEBB_009732 [Seison nebaliae]